MSNVATLIAQINALPPAERTILVNHIAHGVEPIAPVPLSVTRDDEGEAILTLPDGTEVNLDGDLIEVDASMRWNYCEVDLDSQTVHVVQRDGDYETVAYAIERGGRLIPVALDDDAWQVNWS